MPFWQVQPASKAGGQKQEGILLPVLLHTELVNLLPPPPVISEGETLLSAPPLSLTI